MDLLGGGCRVFVDEQPAQLAQALTTRSATSWRRTSPTRSRILVFTARAPDRVVALSGAGGAGSAVTGRAQAGRPQRGPRPECPGSPPRRLGVQRRPAAVAIDQHTPNLERVGHQDRERSRHPAGARVEHRDRCGARAVPRARLPVSRSDRRGRQGGRRPTARSPFRSPVSRTGSPCGRWARFEARRVARAAAASAPADMPLRAGCAKAPRTRALTADEAIGGGSPQRALGDCVADPQASCGRSTFEGRSRVQLRAGRSPPRADGLFCHPVPQQLRIEERRALAAAALHRADHVVEGWPLVTDGGVMAASRATRAVNRRRI